LILQDAMVGIGIVWDRGIVKNDPIGENAASKLLAPARRILPTAMLGLGKTVEPTVLHCAGFPAPGEQRALSESDADENAQAFVLRAQQHCARSEPARVNRRKWRCRWKLRRKVESPPPMGKTAECGGEALRGRRTWKLVRVVVRVQTLKLLMSLCQTVSCSEEAGGVMPARALWWVDLRSRFPETSPRAFRVLINVRQGRAAPA